MPARVAIADRRPSRSPGPSDAVEELAGKLISTGRQAGLDAVGIASADVFASTRADLHHRKAEGLSGTMAFTYRNPDRSTDPGRVLSGARSLVVGALSYRRSEPGPVPSQATGRVARYSWDDYYARLREMLACIAGELSEAGWMSVVVVDDNALVDREAAYRAGIGWYGKNSLLLIPRRGSWFLLGSVVTDAPLPSARGRVEDGCGTCTRCIDSCPTGAIVRPGTVDARRCLAWLLEAPGDFPVAFRDALGDRVYGCDECQLHCPPNRSADRRDPPPPPAAGEEPWADLVSMVRSSDEELLARYGRWYIAGRDPRYIRRNALVALGNVAVGDDPQVEGALRAALASGVAMLELHASWAAGKLGRLDLLRGGSIAAGGPCEGGAHGTAEGRGTPGREMTGRVRSGSR